MFRREDLDLIQRDPEIPGLRCLLEPGALLGRLQATDELDGLSTIDIDYLRYKPAENCLARIRCTVDGEEVWGYAKAHGQSAAGKLEKAAQRQAESPAGAGRALLRDLAIEVNLLPHDNRLKSLERMATPSSADALMKRVFKHGPDWRGIEWTTLTYKPERRLAARVDHGDGERSIVKFFTPARFRHTREFHKHLREVPGLPLPRLIGGSKSHHIMAFDWIEGETLGWRRGPDDTAAIAQAGMALARFHGSIQDRLLPLEQERLPVELAAVATNLAALAPELSENARVLAERLSTFWLGLPGQRVPVHGDFYANQVIIGPNEPALIDCDNAHLGHPGLDLGNFLARFEYLELAGAWSAADATGVAEAFLGAYETTAVSCATGDLGPFIAIGLFRLLHKPFRDREAGWPERMGRILARCERLAGA